MAGEHSTEALRSIAAAVKAAGSIRAAADKAGINYSTMKSQVERVRKHLPDALPPVSNQPGWAQTTDQWKDCVAPEIECADEDLDAIMDKLEEEDEREAKARASLEWMEFQVKGNEPFALVFVGDPHADTCSIRLLRQHLKIVENTPRMWAVGLGDWINQWQPKLRGQYAFQSTTERTALRIVEWMFQRPIWWAILLGNHNGGRWHGDGAALKWMRTASLTPTQEWQVKFTIRSGEAIWKVWAAHNFPGNSTFNVNHGPDKRALFTGAIADLFVAGDRHTYKLSHDQHEHTGRTFWTARAKGYKRFDLYPEEMGWSGKQNIGHSIGAVFDPRDGSLQCFSDVEKTASYLEFLRGRQ
jgi:hypothetical protein